jgi:MFS family permease
LSGDYLVARAGSFKTLIFGSLTAVTGICVILLSSITIIALLGFVLIGLGAANLVPVLFSAAGRQRIMPPGIAIAAVTTTGYAGLLMGPAIIGIISDTLSLSAAFWLLALLMLFVPLSARLVAGVGKA